MGFVQSAPGGTATSGSTVTATFSSPTTAGNTIVVLVSNLAAVARTVSSISLTGASDTFTKAVGLSANVSVQLDTEIWADANCSGGHTAVVVTFSGAITDAELNVIEWNGLSGTADKTQTNDGQIVSSWSTGSTGTLSQASEVAFGVVCVDALGGEITITGPASPWTNLAQVTADPVNGDAQMAGYKQVSATTALTYNGTTDNAMVYVAAIATFKNIVSTYSLY